MLEHRRRDIDPDDAPGAPGQGKGEPANPAAEVERVRDGDLPRQRGLDGRQQCGDVRLAGLEELLRASAAEVRLARQDREVWFALRELLPIGGMAILHLIRI